jgi:hypothetical protein
VSNPDDTGPTTNCWPSWRASDYAESQFTAGTAYKDVVQEIGMFGKSARCRLCRYRHKRHTFAVRALESSPTGRQRIGQHMLALATYMGHVNINATYWYLETTPELLRDIAAVAENFAQGGRE